jgi:hypothetical protein
MCGATSHVRFAPNSDRESGFPQTVMSALPPKADMCSALAHVSFGPIPVIASKYQEFGRSFGSLIARLRASDMGSWMLMLLGGIGFSNHRT